MTYKNFVQSGSLFSGDLNGIQDEYELGYKGYKFFTHKVIRILTDVVSDTRYLFGGDLFEDMEVNNTEAYSSLGFLIPSGHTAGSRVVKLIAIFNSKSASLEFSSTFGVGTVTVSNTTGVPYITALTPEATVSGTVSAVTPTFLATNPITISDTNMRAAFFQPHISGDVDNFCGSCSIFIKQE